MTNYEKIKSMSVDEMEHFLEEVQLDSWFKGNNEDYEAPFDKQWLESETEPTYCKDCKHLMFSDFEGECSKGYKGIVNPRDTCEHAEKREVKSNG